jgi:hypothetical protein
VKIQPQWAVTPGKQTNKQTELCPLTSKYDASIDWERRKQLLDGGQLKSMDKLHNGCVCNSGGRRGVNNFSSENRDICLI